MDGFKVATINQLIDLSFIIYALVVSLLNTAFASVMVRKFMQILQSSGYRGREYARWTYRRDNVYITRLAMVIMLSSFAYLLFNIAFSFIDKEWTAQLGFAFYILFVLIYIKADFKRKSKSRIVFTGRLIRLFATFLILYFLLTFGVILLMQVLGFFFRENESFLVVRFFTVCLTPMSIPVVAHFSSFLNAPFEKRHNKKYVDKCTATLSDAKDLIKIGITGSFAKTSVKEILKTILSTKYKVLATPKSYNTPMGICKCVNSYDGTQDVFICEMGARYVGDIKEIVNMVKPDCAIITGVSNQHLSTFGSTDAIVSTKYELIQGLKEGSFAVFSADNHISKGMSYTCRKEGKVTPILAGVQQSDDYGVYATDIESDKNGSTFTLNFDGEAVSVTTKLIGKHNITNICQAAAVAYKLGMRPEEIALGVSLVKVVSHRLEVSDNGRGMTIIDDSYNSNVEGTIAALDVFATFEGRKIIITPGLVELGRMEDLENFRFGQRLAKVVDYAILVGHPNCYKIRNGMLEGGFPLEKIKIVKELPEAIKHLTEITKEGDVVLFENDLPDKFV